MQTAEFTRTVRFAALQCASADAALRKEVMAAYLARVSVTELAAAAHVTRQTIYRWIELEEATRSGYDI